MTINFSIKSARCSICGTVVAEDFLTTHLFLIHRQTLNSSARKKISPKGSAPNNINRKKPDKKKSKNNDFNSPQASKTISTSRRPATLISAPTSSTIKTQPLGTKPKKKKEWVLTVSDKAQIRKPKKYKPTFTPAWISKLIDRTSHIKNRPAVDTAIVRTNPTIHKAPQTPTAASLGEAVSKEGKAVGTVTKAGMRVRYENAPCTCGGLNENCFRCDGTGYYTREIVESFVQPNQIDEIRKHGARTATPQEISFSNDPRGDNRAIREIGRFESSPLRDDHDS